jgi:hypothetical protein
LGGNLVEGSAFGADNRRLPQIEKLGAAIGCPCRKSDPDVTMVQSAEDRQRQNAPYSLDRPR